MPSRFARRGAFAAALAAALLVLPSVASADVEAEIDDDVLEIISDADADRIKLAVDPAAPTTRVAILVNEFDRFAFDRADFDRIQVIGGGGGDRVDIEPEPIFTNTEPTTLNLGPGNDIFVGGNGDETVLGEEGNDELRGGPGEDTLLGGPDDDRITGGDGEDLVTGGAGNDVFAYASLDDGDELRAGDDRDILDVALRDVGDDVNISTRDGGVVRTRVVVHNVDTTDLEVVKVTGGDGPDDVSNGADAPIELVADGGDGVDRLTGGPLEDRLTGGPRVDVINARGGDDVIDGGEGDDRLAGNEGTNTLTGGPGGDTFFCQSGAVNRVLDPEPVDNINDECELPREPDPPAGPAPQPEPPAGGPGAPSGPPAPVVPPVPGGGAGNGGELPRGALGFDRPRIALARTGLKVVVRNTHSAPVRVSFAASERRGRKQHRYARVTKTIAAGRRVTVSLRAPRALLKQLKPRAAGRRRAAVTLTNVATGGKLTVRR